MSSSYSPICNWEQWQFFICRCSCKCMQLISTTYCTFFSRCHQRNYSTINLARMLTSSLDFSTSEYISDISKHQCEPRSFTIVGCPISWRKVTDKVLYIYKICLTFLITSNQRNSQIVLKSTGWMKSNDVQTIQVSFESHSVPWDGNHFSLVFLPFQVWEIHLPGIFTIDIYSRELSKSSHHYFWRF